MTRRTPTNGYQVLNNDASIGLGNGGTNSGNNNTGSSTPTSVTTPPPPPLQRNQSAGVPPKIIHPTKNPSASGGHGSGGSNQPLSTHSQIPGSANVAAKTNAAAAALAAQQQQQQQVGSGSSNKGLGGSGGQLNQTSGGAGSGGHLSIGIHGSGGNLGAGGSASGQGSGGALPGTGGGNSTGAMAAGSKGLKIKQPMRTTKTSQKLTLFPEEKDVPVLEDAYAFEDSVYNQIGQLSSGTARHEAQRMSKMDRQKLPRVIAYCTASSYRMDDLFNFLQSRKIPNGTAPKRFDECIYTPFSYSTPGTTKPPTTANLLGLDESATGGLDHGSTAIPVKELVPELLYFDYGVVVIWGMTEYEEKRLLMELSRFEEEKLDEDDVETEEFSFHYDSQYQPRIYNDVITLKSPGNYMIKLTISHAIAQSVKMTLFEGLIENTINATKNIPQTMAETGKVPMSRTQITKKIGQLFIMRINVNLVSNILDTPEIFWSEPSYQSLYSAIRGYLEIGQRVELLNQRTAVISDLLDMLKEHLQSSHGEQLEWIVIVLIFFEIVIGLITICLDAINL